jgi:ATP-dependent exoDNAse (exonuclease V) alpha subunit
MEKNDILLMDEFSMITRRWYDQARQQFKHIFLFGDLMQLPPIDDDGIDVSRVSTLTLQRSMRTQTLQEEQQYVRAHGLFPTQNTLHFANTQEMPLADVAAKIVNNPVNVGVLVWRNATRQKINLLCNPESNLGVNVPVAVLMSSYDVHEDCETDAMLLEKKPHIKDTADWYSGCTYSKSERLVIQSIRPHTQFAAVSVVTFHGHTKPAYVVKDKADFFRFRYIPFSKEARYRHKDEGVYPIPLLWVELAYAQTCHKWQGSEVKNLIIVNEIPTGRFDSWKWRYTAITRAAEKCIVVSKLQN